MGSLDAKHGHPWDPLMQSMDIHEFLVCNLWMPPKNGKIKYLVFLGGFFGWARFLTSPAHTKRNPTPSTSWGRDKITFEGLCFLYFLSFFTEFLSSQELFSSPEALFLGVAFYFSEFS
jgi:hypothetical protein